MYTISNCKAFTNCTSWKTCVSASLPGSPYKLTQYEYLPYMTEMVRTLVGRMFVFPVRALVYPSPWYPTVTVRALVYPSPWYPTVTVRAIVYPSRRWYPTVTVSRSCYGISFPLVSHCNPFCISFPVGSHCNCNNFYALANTILRCQNHHGL